MNLFCLHKHFKVNCFLFYGGIFSLKEKTLETVKMLCLTLTYYLVFYSFKS